MKHIKSETSPEYKADAPYKPEDFDINDCYMIDGPEFDTWRDAENECIRQAKCALYRRMVRFSGDPLTSPQDTTDYLELELAEEEQEVFCAIFLNTRHQVIEFRRMFYGTIDSASIHPREVAKAALKANAAAVIFAHNHPSGNPEPSQSDIGITARLKTTLALLDIKTLDHIIVGSNGNTTSLASRGHI